MSELTKNAAPEWIDVAFADGFGWSTYAAHDGECAAKAQIIAQLEAERDEARAQVAAAYEAAAIRSENYARGAPYNQRASINALANSIRALTPAHAKSAIDTYGREKVREGMQRVADAIENRCYDDPALAGHGFIALIRDAILAAMEKDGEK